MPTYLYCVLAPTSADGVPEGLAGIGGAAIRALKTRELAPLEAWVATVDDALLRVSGRALAAQALMHNDVVNAALRAGRTPAPARYGSRFPDDAACVADLERRAAELHEILDHVAGAVELSALLVSSKARGSRVVKPDRSDPAAGRRYLESIRARVVEEDGRRRAAQAEADRLDDSVRALVRDEARSFTPTGVLAIAHLVPTEKLVHYRTAVAAFVPSADFRLVVGEPRAPYSFASPRSSDEAGHDSGSPNRNE
jgi:hypothetical protein